jgi:hypothetical protein
MNKRELNSERRKQRALERLGTNTPWCAVCGFDDPAALELHHIPGRGFGEELVIVCRNCHRLLGDERGDNAPHRTDAAGELASLGHFLLGLADLFELLVKRFREFATKLFAAEKQSQGGEAQQ